MRSLSPVLAAWVFFLTSNPGFSDTESSGWSVGTGVAAPSLASALRLNPASATGRGNVAEVKGRMAYVTGGPIPAADVIWADPGSSFAMGAGGEYSLATRNPEVHLGLGWRFLKDHSLGLSASLRKTASQSRSMLGISTHSKVSERLGVGFRFDGIGAGKEALEGVLGAALQSVFWDSARIEADLAFVSSSKLIHVRPAFASALPWGLAAAISLDIPTGRLGSFSTAVALGYESARFGTQFRLANNLDGEVGVSLRF